MRRKLKIYVITVILAFMVLVVGLWSYRTPQPGLRLAPLRVGHLVADELHQPGWCVAEERGFIKAEGFRAIHSEYIHGPQEMEHFAAGELDVAYVGAAPFLVARASGVGIVAVASSNTEGSSLVVANDIHNISDLQGMKIGSPGIGTIQDYILTQTEKKFSIKFTHFYAKVTDLILYFEKGEIAGYIAWEPHSTRAVAERIRGSHIILTSHEILPGHQCCVLAVREDWVRQRPDDVMKIVRWHMVAQKWVLDHPQEAESIMANYSGLPLDLIREAHPIVKHPYPPYLDMESCRIMTEGLILTDKIRKVDVPDLDKFLNGSLQNSFVRSLAEQLIPTPQRTAVPMCMYASARAQLSRKSVNCVGE